MNNIDELTNAYALADSLNQRLMHAEEEMNMLKEEHIAIIGGLDEALHLLLEARKALDNVGMIERFIDYEGVREVKKKIVNMLEDNGVEIVIDVYDNVVDKSVDN